MAYGELVKEKGKQWLKTDTTGYGKKESLTTISLTIIIKGKAPVS